MSLTKLLVPTYRNMLQTLAGLLKSGTANARPGGGPARGTLDTRYVGAVTPNTLWRLIKPKRLHSGCAERSFLCRLLKWPPKDGAPVVCLDRS